MFRARLYEGLWLHILHLGTYVKKLSKMVYLKNRRYLPLDSKWRDDCKNFPEKAAELRTPSPLRKFERVKSLHFSYDAAKAQ